MGFEFFRVWSDTTGPKNRLPPAAIQCYALRVGLLRFPRGQGEITQADLTNIVCLIRNRDHLNRQIDEAARQFIDQLSRQGNFEDGDHQASLETMTLSGVRYDVLLIDGTIRYQLVSGPPQAQSPDPFGLK